MDIQDHKFSDDDIYDQYGDDEDITIYSHECQTEFNKIDVISMSKNFKLTADDLNTD